MTGFPRPRNLAGVAWRSRDGRRAAFAAARPGFGVEVAPGVFLASDGERPSVWSTKAVAAVIAATPPPWPTVEAVA